MNRIVIGNPQIFKSSDLSAQDKLWFSVAFILQNVQQLFRIFLGILTGIL